MNSGLDWQVIFGPEGRHLLATGLWVTIQLSFYSIVFSTVVGLLIAMGRVSQSAVLTPLRAVLAAITEIFRNIPLLVHLAFWNFGIFGFAWVQAAVHPATSLYSLQFLASICALVTYRCSYVAEVFRSGLQSIPKGQMEAARATGLSYGKTMRRVVLPQVARIVIPPLGNQYVGVTKNTSVVLVIGVKDLVFQAYQIESVTFQVFLAFGSVMVIFSAVCLLESAALNWCARWMDRKWGGAIRPAGKKQVSAVTA